MGSERGPSGPDGMGEGGGRVRAVSEWCPNGVCEVEEGGKGSPKARPQGKGRGVSDWGPSSPDGAGEGGEV